MQLSDEKKQQLIKNLQLWDTNNTSRPYTEDSVVITAKLQRETRRGKVKEKGAIAVAIALTTMIVMIGSVVMNGGFAPNGGGYKGGVGYLPDKQRTAEPVLTSEPPSIGPSTVTSTELPAGIPLTLYYPDDQVESLLTKEVTISKLEKEEITNALIAQGVLAKGVQVRKLEERETKGVRYLMIDFNEEFLTQLNSYGTAGEYFTMQSVTNTFLTAYHYDFLFVTVDGKVIETGHNLYKEYLEFHDMRSE